MNNSYNVELNLTIDADDKEASLWLQGFCGDVDARIDTKRVEDKIATSLLFNSLNHLRRFKCIAGFAAVQRDHVSEWAIVTNIGTVSAHNVELVVGGMIQDAIYLAPTEMEQVLLLAAFEAEIKDEELLAEADARHKARRRTRGQVPGLIDIHEPKPEPKPKTVMENVASTDREAIRHFMLTTMAEDKTMSFVQIAGGKNYWLIRHNDVMHAIMGTVAEDGIAFGIPNWIEHESEEDQASLADEVTNTLHTDRTVKILGHTLLLCDIKEEIELILNDDGLFITVGEQEPHKVKVEVIPSQSGSAIREFHLRSPHFRALMNAWGFTRMERTLAELLGITSLVSFTVLPTKADDVIHLDLGIGNNNRTVKALLTTLAKGE